MAALFGFKYVLRIDGKPMTKTTFYDSDNQRLIEAAHTAGFAGIPITHTVREGPNTGVKRLHLIRFNTQKVECKIGTRIFVYELVQKKPQPQPKIDYDCYCCAHTDLQQADSEEDFELDKPYDPTNKFDNAMAYSRRHDPKQLRKPKKAKRWSDRKPGRSVVSEANEARMLCGC